MGEEFLVAISLRTRDLVREEVWRVYRILLGVARSELEDKIEQFIGGSMLNNIGGDIVRLAGRPTK